MKETKLQSDMLDVISSNNGLKMYLTGLLTGHDATPQSSLYNIRGKTRMLKPETILERWQRKLEQLSKGSDFEQRVFQFDSAQLQKWGPQGAVAPIADLMDEVVGPEFEPQPQPRAFSSREWKIAKTRVSKYLFEAGCHGLRPVPYHRVVDDMRARDTLVSNSGWPLFTRRSKPEVVAASIEDAQNGNWKNYPAIALFRNYNQKTRLVWMFPMSANLVEGSYFQVLQSKLMRSRFSEEFLAPWLGFDQVRDLMNEMYSSSESGHRMWCVAASDFSSTDAHFKLAASLEVCSVLEYCFQPQYRPLLRESITHMHSIPLIVGPDTMIVGEHGVSSGSNWTNFLETIFDWIFSEYVRIKEETISDSVYRGLYAIGDDMSWYVPYGGFDPAFSTRLEAYGKEVGQIVKAEKTTNDKDSVKSLQRLFQAGYLNSDGSVRAVYPTIRALKSLVYPERMHKRTQWNKNMAAVRAFMILENTVDHPLFEEFCKFVSDGDPNLKVVARMTKGQQNHLLRESRSIAGLNTTYNQEKRGEMLSQFRSVSLIAKL